MGHNNPTPLLAAKVPQGSRRLQYAMMYCLRSTAGVEVEAWVCSTRIGGGNTPTAFGPNTPSDPPDLHRKDKLWGWG